MEFSSNGSETLADNKEKQQPKSSDSDGVTVEQYVQSILQNAIHTGKDIPVIPLSIQPTKAADAITKPPSNPGEKCKPLLPSISSAFTGKSSVGSGAIPKRRRRQSKSVAQAYQDAIANFLQNQQRNKLKTKKRKKGKTAKERSPKKGEKRTENIDGGENCKTGDKPKNISDNSVKPTRKSNRLPNARKVLKMGAIMYD